MATRPQTVSHLLDLMSGAGDVTARKMFGEYGVYLDGKMVALICDDQLFLRPVPEAVALMPGARMAAPYPNSKPHIAPDAEMDDRDLMARTLRVIAAQLPAPKPKPKPKV